MQNISKTLGKRELVKVGHPGWRGLLGLMERGQETELQRRERGGDKGEGQRQNDDVRGRGRERERQMERQRNCSCENTEKEREPGRGGKQGERRKDKYETRRDRRRRERELVRGPAVNLRGLPQTERGTMKMVRPAWKTLAVSCQVKHALII